MEQTGIKYLAEQLKYYDFEKSEQSYEFKITVAKFNELIEKAQAIEKQQMDKSFQDGMDKGYYVGGGTR